MGLIKLQMEKGLISLCGVEVQNFVNQEETMTEAIMMSHPIKFGCLEPTMKIFKVGVKNCNYKVQ